VVDTLIVGSGIAGLVAAWKLKRSGRSVVVVEAQERAGGNVHTIEEQGYRMECGPHSFMGSSEYIWALLEIAGLTEEVEPAAPVAANRFIYRFGRLLPLPLSAGSFLGSPLLSVKGKLRLAMEPFIRSGAKPDDTAWDFFERRFGVEAASYIMSPFISGIYAGDIHQLGARAAFPKFWRFEKESGSMIRGALKYMKAKRKRLRAEGKPIRAGLYSMKGGLGRITKFLECELANSVFTGMPVTSVARNGDQFEVRCGGQTMHAGTVVLACPPHKSAEVLAAACPEASASLSGVPMVPVALVHWSIPETRLDLPEGFGFLVPRSENVRLLGTLFPSQLFSGRAPQGAALMASFFGGALDREAATLPESDLVALLRQEHERILGHDPGAPEMVRVLRYSHAIPQLLPDHPERIQSARDALARMPGLVLAGNYLSGVGIEQAVESGFAAAESVEKLLEGRSGVANVRAV